MKEKVIGVIGGTGGMGRWLVELLQQERYQVHVCGRKTPLSVEDLVRLCNVIVVAVPIDVTAEVIRRVGPLMPADSLLMDLTSLKKEPVESMLSCSRADVMGCHPLFGPLIQDLSGQNLILCPARGGSRWIDWLKMLFGGKGLIVTEATTEEHDRMMAIVQLLNHLNTMTLGLALADTGISLAEISKFSTPIFRNKLEIIKKVFTEKSGLYTDIIARNPAKGKMFDLYEKALQDIFASFESGDGTQWKKLAEEAAKKLF